MQPKDENELVDMLHTGLSLNGPRLSASARAPVASRSASRRRNYRSAQAETSGMDPIYYLGAGSMVQDALDLATTLEREHHLSVGVVNARFVKPLDRVLLLSQAAVPLLVTMEDHALSGGFGSAVLEALQEAECTTAVERIGWPIHLWVTETASTSCALHMDSPGLISRGRCSTAGRTSATRT